MNYTTVTLNPGNVPQLLRQHVHWLLWHPEASYQPKAPRTIRRGDVELSSVHATDDYLSFEEAVDWSAEGYGIGFVLRRSPAEERLERRSLICIDIDGKLSEAQQQLPPEEQLALIQEKVNFQESVIRRLGCYAERSPSGRGVHIWCTGLLPFDGRKHGDFEVYASKRFITVTGEHIPGTPKTIEPVHQETFDALLDELLPNVAQIDPATLDIPPYRGAKVDLDAFLTERLGERNFLTRIATEHGAWETIMMDGPRGPIRRYPTQSEADFALMGVLARLTRSDTALMDHLFRQSALMRPKYEERRGNSTAGEIMVAKTATAHAPPIRRRPDTPSPEPARTIRRPPERQRR